MAVDYIPYSLACYLPPFSKSGFSTVHCGHSVAFNSAIPWISAHQASLSCLSPTPRAYSNSCPSCRWCHPIISSSVIPFSSHIQSYPASGSFPLSQFFASGGQCIGVSASSSVLPMNIQDWFPLGWTGWISLLSKRLSKVFSNTTLQKHQFFLCHLSLSHLSFYFSLSHLSFYCHIFFSNFVPLVFMYKTVVITLVYWLED